MGGNYESKNARMLLLSTAAVESKCGYYIKQVGGPALGIWQMEPDTATSIDKNSDALRRDDFKIYKLVNENRAQWIQCLIESPMYACAMARLKYSMDSEPLPAYDDINAIYKYYKRIYNTEAGASTLKKFIAAWDYCELDKVKL